MPNKKAKFHASLEDIPEHLRYNPDFDDQKRQDKLSENDITESSDSCCSSSDDLSIDLGIFKMQNSARSQQITFEDKRNLIIEEHLEKQKPKERVKVEEDDFLKNEVISISSDVYNLTIAANMTKNCSPLELNFCIK